MFRVPPLASEPAATGNATLLGGEITLERKISLTELADRVGITMANLSILKNNKARAVRFSTLDALCRELDCQPGDIYPIAPVKRKNRRINGYLHLVCKAIRVFVLTRSLR